MSHETQSQYLLSQLGNVALPRAAAITGGNLAHELGVIREKVRQAHVQGQRVSDVVSSDDLYHLELALRMSRGVWRADRTPASDLKFPNGLDNGQVRAVCSRATHAIARIDRDVHLHESGKFWIDSGNQLGTGFLASSEHIVTCAHVIRSLQYEKGSVAASVGLSARFGVSPTTELNSNRRITEVVSIDDDYDLAVLRIEPTDRRPLEFGEASDNSPVIAMGFPADDERRNPVFMNEIFSSDGTTHYGELHGSAGIVRAKRGDWLTHDCTTLGGHSGSPLFNTEGNVVGVHGSGAFMLANRALNGIVAADLFQQAIGGTEGRR